MKKKASHKIIRVKPRGGASCACPHTGLRKKPPVPCGANSRVLKTRRTATGGVLRFRECTAGHRFTTEENPHEE